MKRLLKSLALLLFGCQLFGQCPDMDYNYSQFGFNAGYAYGEVKSGPSIGVIHGSVVGHNMFFEGSASKLAWCNEESISTKLIALELGVIDMGLGYNSPGFFAGVSPFSINLTQSPCFGLAILSKCRIMEDYSIEVKLLPVVYGKPERYGLFNNNFYFGAHYWFSESFSLGLRYNRYSHYGNFGIMAS